jgi:hypothetical protein
MDTAKVVLRGKFIAMSVYVKRTERSQIMTYATTQTPRKTRANQTQIKQKREIIKIRAEIMK